MVQNKIILFAFISSLWLLFNPFAKTPENKITPVSFKSEVISCTYDNPFAVKGSLFANVQSAQTGNWSSPSTWVGGVIPLGIDSARINAGHIVTVDQNVTVNGILIYGTLKFKVDATVTLQSTRNIVGRGNGLLQMRPNSAAIRHTLRFINVNEAAIFGGGADVLESDVGLWMMENSYLDQMGTYKKSWTNAVGSLSAGATQITVLDATGWQIGDTVRIFPTRSPYLIDPFQAIVGDFESRAITAKSGNTITLSTALSFPHPTLAMTSWKTVSAEVTNNSRNVRVEGTLGHKSHTFMRSSHPQFIGYVEYNFMGPRKDKSNPADGVPEPILGRYVMHFHRSFDGSRGSYVEGCVANYPGNRVYVPHLSNGVTMRDNVAYYAQESVFWWDPGEPSFDIVWNHNCIGLVTFDPNANVGVDSDDPNGDVGDSGPQLANTAFFLGLGFEMTCDSNVVAGNLGDNNTAGGYFWQANNDGVWNFRNNLAHNCSGGYVVWQVTEKSHTVEDFFTYHNILGVYHGAYANSYRFSGGVHYASPFHLKAAPFSTARIKFDHITFDGGNQVDYPIELLPAPVGSVAPPVMFFRDTFKNGIVADFIDYASVAEGGEEGPFEKDVDMIFCNIAENRIILHEQSWPGESIRVQPITGTPYELYHTCMGCPEQRRNIAAFAPTFFGDSVQNDRGNQGLKGVYYRNANFTDSGSTRLDHFLDMDWDSLEAIFYPITDRVFSVRWTGFLIPQFTETYKIYMISADGGGSNQLKKVWINDVVYVNNSSSAIDSFSIPFVRGQRYSIRIDWSNNDQDVGITVLAWSSPSLEKFTDPSGTRDGINTAEIIPQSQMFATVEATPNIGTVFPCQQVGYEIGFGLQALVRVPCDYLTSPANTKYPVVVFLAGIGETDTTSLKTQGFPKRVGSLGFNAEQVMPGGGTIKYIVMSIPWNDYQDGNNFDYIMDWFITNFTKTDTSDYRLWNLTGLSMGAGYSWFHRVNDDGNAQFGHIFRNIVTASVTLLPQTTYDKIDVVPGADLRGWLFHGLSDGDGINDNGCCPPSNSQTIYNLLNATGTNKQITLMAGDHDPSVWDAMTNPAGNLETNNVWIWMAMPLVGEPNQAPTASAGANQTVTYPATINLTGSGVDIDGTIASYLWTKQSGPAGGTITSPTSANTMVTGLASGTYVFRLTVTDNDAATGFDDVDIILNVRPTANAGVDQVKVLPTNTATLSGSGADTDGTIIYYVWTKQSGPAGGTFSDDSISSPVVSALQAGTYIFRLTVTDNRGEIGIDQMTVQVNPNQAPVANAGPDKSIVTPVTTTTLTGSGTDADGTIASYLWTKQSGPAGGTISTPTASTTNITALQAGTYVFRLTVTDNGGATHFDQATVNVTASNVPPIANAAPDQNLATPLAHIQLYGSLSSDPDGFIASYHWERISGPTVTWAELDMENIQNPRIINVVVGVYVMRLTVTDNLGAINTDDVTITVDNPPIPGNLHIRGRTKIIVQKN